MKKQNLNFTRALVTSGKVVSSSKRRFLIFMMFSVLFVGALVPGFIYLGRYIDNMLNQEIKFSGNYLPTDLCSKSPFNKLQWCNILDDPVLINYDNLTDLRNTQNEAYTSHISNGRVFAYYDEDSTKNDGEILSSNLRFEYAYNYIVQQINENAQELDPNVTSVKVSLIDVTKASGVFSSGPLSYNFVDQNQAKGALLTVYGTDQNNSSLTFNVPVFIFNNSRFYNRYFNFMVDYHQINYYNNRSLPSSQGNQLNGIFMGSNGRNIIMPQSILDSANSEAINSWLYKYYTEMMSQVYVANWKQFATNFSDLNANNNPFRNFILYAPEARGLPNEAMYHNDRDTIFAGLSSVIFNPLKPTNVIPLALFSPITLTKQLIDSPAIVGRNNLTFYTLFLDPQYSLSFYYEQLGGDIVSVITTINELLDISNRSPKELIALAEKYPFLTELNFEPFQPSLLEESYNRISNKQHWYLGNQLSVLQDDQKSLADPKNRMLFFYQNWSNINNYPITNSNNNINFNVNPYSQTAFNDSLNIIRPSVSTINLIRQFGSITITIDSNQLVVSNVNEYFDDLARLQMFKLEQQVVANYLGTYTNVPNNFIEFYNEINTSDIQILTTPEKAIYMNFLDKYNGLNTENGPGYYSANAIENNINNVAFRNNITRFDAFYKVAGISPTTSNFGEPLIPYMLNYYRQTFSFDIYWES